MEHVSSRPREAARQILATCYKANIIGTYRRIGAGSWRIHLSDGDLILDDSQVVEMYGRSRLEENLVEAVEA